MLEPGSGIFHVLYVSTLLLARCRFCRPSRWRCRPRISRRKRIRRHVRFAGRRDFIRCRTFRPTFKKPIARTRDRTFLLRHAWRVALFDLRRLASGALQRQIQRSQRAMRKQIAIQKKHFTGLPIPAAALAAVSANLFLASPFAEQYFPLAPETKAIILSSLMIILGYFMVSRWKFPSSKALHFRVPSFQLVFVTVILAIFVFYGILYFFSIMLAVLTWGYITPGMDTVHHPINRRQKIQNIGRF